MPDLITHIAISHLCRRPFEKAGTISPSLPFRTIFYLGTLLPDLLSRPFIIIFPATFHWVTVFHTPAGFLVVSLLISSLFHVDIRRRIFINLSAGGLLHFFLDSLQKQVLDNDFWLFPFSWKTFGKELFHTHDILHYSPVLLVLIVIMELYFPGKDKKK